MNPVQLVQHGRRLVLGPDIEGRCILGRTPVAVVFPEGLGHAFVEKVTQRSFHALDHLLSPRSHARSSHEPSLTQGGLL